LALGAFPLRLPHGTLLFRDVNNKGKSARIREDRLFIGLL